MERLGEKDLRGALDFLETLGPATTPERFRSSVTTGLSRLIPCDVVTYNELDPRTGEILWVTDPVESAAVADREAFLRNLHQHPVIPYYRTTPDPPPATLDDFLSRRQLHRTALYNEFFRPLDIEAQLTGLFNGPMPLIVGININRDRLDFSARDRLVFELLVPYLERAYEAVAARALAERALAALERGAASAGESVLVLSPDGTIEAASAGSLETLRRHFGPSARAATHRRSRSAHGFAAAGIEAARPPRRSTIWSTSATEPGFSSASCHTRLRRSPTCWCSRSAGGVRLPGPCGPSDSPSARPRCWR